MSVRELINYLSQFDPNAIVLIKEGDARASPVTTCTRGKWHSDWRDQYRDQFTIVGSREAAVLSSD